MPRKRGTRRKKLLLIVEDIVDQYRWWLFSIAALALGFSGLEFSVRVRVLLVVAGTAINLVLAAINSKSIMERVRARTWGYNDLYATSVRELDRALLLWRSLDYAEAKTAVRGAEQALLNLIAQGMADTISTEDQVIYSNLMLPTKDKKELNLLLYGSQSGARPNRPDMPPLSAIDENEPGAPEAFVKGFPVYIDDITKPEYRKAFGRYVHIEDKFRSVLVIPLFPGKIRSGNPVGILNVDAVDVDAFPEDIQKNFAGLSKPWRCLLGLAVTLHENIEATEEASRKV